MKRYVSGLDSFAKASGVSRNSRCVPTTWVPEGVERVDGTRPSPGSRGVSVGVGTSDGGLSGGPTAPGLWAGRTGQPGGCDKTGRTGDGFYCGETGGVADGRPYKKRYVCMDTISNKQSDYYWLFYLFDIVI